jgi:hypothetical protein
MGDFFKGWRRKIGVVTLGLACVFMAGWLRSATIRDDVMIAGENVRHALASSTGLLRWARHTGIKNTDQKNDARQILNAGRPLIEWNSAGDFQKDDNDSFWKHCTNEWRHGWGGFDFGAGTHKRWNCHIERWAIPYWSIVIPLTLLSAWLLLSKPRHSNQKKPIEPIPETVA